MRKNTRAVTVIIAFFVALSTLSMALTQPAHAVSGSDFNAGRIIDDGVFFNSGTMTTSVIQSFLNAKVPSCRAGYTCLKDYHQSFESQAADSYCGAIAGGTKSAADIIFNVARACGVNPQSLIVLLQKEQSLITDDWPLDIQYRSATGYGCPDTAACDSQYYGFFNQVYRAARQFKRYIAHPDQYNFAVGRTSAILFNPNSGCGSSNVTIHTRATAALYNYTPYQPNVAALANLYGLGDSCSAYGNRNFWRQFNDWFGTTLIDSFTIALDSSNNAQYLLFGGLKQSIGDPNIKIAWGIQDYPLVSMSNNYLSSIPSGPPLDRLTRLNTSDNTVFFMDGGKRYRVMSQAMFDAWNFGGRPITNVPPALFYLPVDGGELTFTVKNIDAATLYNVDGANVSGETILRPFTNATVQKAWEGDNATYTEVSSNFFSYIDNAVGATISSTKITSGGSEYQVVNGKRYAQPSPYNSIYPTTANSVSNTTLNRLLDGGQSSHLVRAASDLTVYLIDNGTKRVVANPSVLSAWTPSGGSVQIVNSNYISLITDGATIDGYAASAGAQTYIMSGNKLAVPETLENAYQQLSSVSVTTYLMSLYPSSNGTLTGFVRAAGTAPVYFLDESGNKRHIDDGMKATLLGAFSTGVTILPSEIVGAFSTAASPQLYVSDGTNEYVLEGGSKHLVGTSVKTDWGLSSPQLYSDGTLARFPTGTALASKLKDSNHYFLIKGGKAFLTVDNNIAGTWGLIDSPQMDQKVLLSIFGNYNMLTRFVASTSDTRIFVIDNGNWYTVSSAQLANLGGTNAPKMGLNPASAPNTITDWTSVVVKDGANKHYVIDNGTKRSFANSIIQNYWTSNDSLNVPTTTNGFLNLLPNNGKVERAIKGSNPAIYAAPSATKRHILSPSTYNSQYAPYEVVSDALLNAMPSGSDI